MTLRLCSTFLGAILLFSSSGLSEKNMSFVDDDQIVHVDPQIGTAAVYEEDLASSSAWALLKLLLVLIAVIALAYLVLHKGVGSLVQKSQANKIIQIKERIALDQKRYLYLVEVADRRFVLGGGDGGVSLISEITPTKDAQAPMNFSSSLHRGASHAYDQKSAQMVPDVHA